MKTVALIQARMASTRLPGKTLANVAGQPLLSHVIARVKQARTLDLVAVATTNQPIDDQVAALCHQLNVPCFRGSENDLLDRYYQAAKYFDADVVVRLTGDCPLADPLVIDLVVSFHLQGRYAYTSNIIEPTYPDGLDVEAFQFWCLEEAWREATLPSQREHVTTFILEQGNRYQLGSVKGAVDYSHLRWTVDEPEDLRFVTTIFEHFYLKKLHFTTFDVLEFIVSCPEIQKLNGNFRRDEGYEKSLQQDIKLIALNGSSKSIKTQLRAKKVIPGMTQLLSKRPDMFSYGLWPGYFSRASGAEIWDLDGCHYLDMSIAGIGANVLGYCDADVDAAVISAVKNGTSTSLNCLEEVELAELLCELHPWAQMVRFARTGGEAMAIAVRIARAATGRDKVAFCGYHGWHDWYLAANLGTDNAPLAEHLLPGLEPLGVPAGLSGTAFPFHYNRLDELEAIVAREGKNLAAIVMEPIRNDSPAPDFLPAIRLIADKIGAVFIFDEISAGFRLVSGGAHLTLGVEPDMAVFSKAMGNGYAMAAIIGRTSVMDAVQRTFISSTYWTERIGPAAALATIAKHRRLNVAEHLVKIGQQVQEAWKVAALNAGLAIDVGGIPPLSHFSFLQGEASVLQALFIQLMLERGILASTSFYAMFAHRDEHVRRYEQSLHEVFGELAHLTKTGQLASALRGSSSASGFARLL